MQINELFNDEKDPGLFIGVKFDNETIENILDFCEQHYIPKSIKPQEIHATVIYSEKYVTVPFDQYKETINPNTFKWNLFGENKDCLVLEFESEKLTNRHLLAKKLGATSSFDEYRPHVTFSYNAPNFDIENLPLPDFELVVKEEYQSAADKDWS